MYLQFRSPGSTRARWIHVFEITVEVTRYFVCFEVYWIFSLNEPNNVGLTGAGTKPI